MNLLFSRNHLMETGTIMPQTHKAANEEGWKQVAEAGAGPDYVVLEKGDLWLIFFSVGKKQCPILVKDWISLIGCLGLLNGAVQGKLLDTLTNSLPVKT